MSVMRSKVVDVENAYIILCDDKDLLREIRGLMADGGGEYLLIEALNISTEDIRNELGEYIGIRVLGYSEDEGNEYESEDEK